MPRILKDQVLAGTGPDHHGPGLDRETVLNLFRQLKQGSPSGANHDLTQEPIVRILNCRLDEIPNGELVIRADLEVLDEDRLDSVAGGFSISFTRLTRRRGPSDDPVLRVLVNPRQFDFDQVCSVVFPTEPSDFTIDVTEKIEKAAVTEIAIIVLALGVFGEITKGFLSAAGAELFRKLRTVKRIDDSGGETEIHLDLKIQSRDTQVRYIMDVASGVTEHDFASLDLTVLQALLPIGVPVSRIDRVVGRISAGPRCEIWFVVLDDGTSIRIQEPET